jgi:hypothetical protein
MLRAWVRTPGADLDVLREIAAQLAPLADRARHGQGIERVGDDQWRRVELGHRRQTAAVGAGGLTSEPLVQAGAAERDPTAGLHHRVHQRLTAHQTLQALVHPVQIHVRGGCSL